MIKITKNEAKRFMLASKMYYLSVYNGSCNKLCFSANYLRKMMEAFGLETYWQDCYLESLCDLAILYYKGKLTSEGYKKRASSMLESIRVSC